MVYQRNRKTESVHRNEVALQIILPLEVGVLVMIILAILAGLGERLEVSRYAQIAVIWIALPLIILGLLLLSLLILLLYAVTRLLGLVSRYAVPAQDWISCLEGWVNRSANTAVEPLLRLESFKAALRHVLSRKR